VGPEGETVLNPDAGSFDLSRVDPAFTAAVGAYVKDVREMEVLSDAQQRARMPGALDRLAEAIETIPLAHMRRPLEAAAHEIRADGGLLGMVEMNPHAVDHAVLVASTVLMDVAGFSYESSPLVLERARALREVVSQLRDVETFRRSTAELLEALRRAALVLTAMHTSVAWGVVP